MHFRHGGRALLTPRPRLNSNLAPITHSHDETTPIHPFGCTICAAAQALMGRHFVLGPLCQSGRKLLARR